MKPPADNFASSRFDVQRSRQDFPILQSKSNGHPLVYLDNAATTQKPRAVIEATQRFYAAQNANIHRGVYDLSQSATAAYEEARRKVQHFINAADSAEIIFTRGTTEAINLVASSWGRANLREGDEVILSAMEHHSNIVPWQLACQASGAVLHVAPVNDAGELSMEEFSALLSPRTKFVSIVHLSNSLGTINDARRICELAHGVGAKVLLDGAQWVAHYPTDVRDIGCDFYAFSGHKLYGPTGVGVLYGRRELLEAMPPYQGGGDMIDNVTFAKTTYAQLPNKFEAGTPNIAGAIGLGAAIDYLRELNWSFSDHEHELLEYATERLSSIPGVRLVGTARRKGGVVSFVMDDPPVSSLDIGTKLDGRGIAVRTGHHCCQPLMDRFGIPGTARASLAMYNTKAEIDALTAALSEIRDEAATKKSHSVSVPATLGLELKYPQSVAPSPQAAADELVEVFDFLGEWDQRYQYVIELGEKLPPMPATLKTDATRVRGCQSIVHLYARRRPQSDDVIEFLADSDANIVRGLIAILQRVFSGQKAADVLSFNVEDFFRRMGLDKYLTTGRRNGLTSMVQRVRLHAKQIEQGAAPSPLAAGAVT